MNRIRRWLLGVGLGATTVCLIAVAGCERPTQASVANPSVADGANSAVTSGTGESPKGHAASTVAISVKTVHPRTDPNFKITVEQPAFVNAYYRADLMARVAGPVKSITVAKGSRVKAGDELLTIDAPDLVDEVYQREAVVLQRQRELELTRQQVKSAEAAVDATKSLVKVRQAEVEQSLATLNFREKELVRYKGLTQGPSPAVTEEVYDERKLYRDSALAAVHSAEAIVDKAKADLKESEAKLAAAQVDIHLKEALVEVARKDKDYAGAMLSFATISAPFDGEITERHVDPGSFVRDAATAQNASLLTLDRVDIVTVIMKVPDNYAPFVTRDTEAVFEIGSLPGVRISSKVARFSGSLVDASHDRTMPVEVDLFNGAASEYDRFVAKEKASRGADLKDRFIPPFPRVTGPAAARGALRLLPGMYGRMRLILNNLQGAYLLPSSAIFSAGGNSYLFIVRDGKAMRTRIDVEVDDGQLAKVALMERENGRNVRRDLKGDEVVVLTNQGELEDGQEVKAIPESESK